MMDTRVKGELGLRLTWLAALAFVLSILGQTLLLSLLLGLVLVKERNDWLTRQTLCAFGLCVASGVLDVADRIVSVLYIIPLLGGFFSAIFGALFSLLNLGLLILAVLGAVRVYAGNENGLPLLDKLVLAAFEVVQRPAKPAAPAPAPAIAPVEAAPAAPEAPAAPAPAPKAPKATKPRAPRAAKAPAAETAVAPAPEAEPAEAADEQPAAPKAPKAAKPRTRRTTKAAAPAAGAEADAEAADIPTPAAAVPEIDS